jgi:hypothetical protein
MRFLLSIGISIMSIFLLTSIIMVNAQTENNIPNMTNSTTLENNDLSLSIGELILESKTKNEGIKISDIDKQEFEISWSGNATLQIDIPVWTHGVALSTLKDDGYWYDKGYGMLVALDNSAAKYTFSSIGKMDDDGKIRSIGSVTFDTNDEGSLSILKNTVGVLADEVDPQGQGIGITKVWKLER